MAATPNYISKVLRVRDAFEHRTAMPATSLRVSRHVHECLKGEFDTRPFWRGSSVLDGENVTVQGMRYSVDPSFGDDMEAIVVEGDQPFDDSEGARSLRATFDWLAERLADPS